MGDSKKSKGASKRGISHDVRFQGYIKAEWKRIVEGGNQRISKVLVDQINFILNRIGEYIAQKIALSFKKPEETILLPNVLSIVKLLTTKEYYESISKKSSSASKKYDDRDEKETKSLSVHCGFSISISRVRRILFETTKRRISMKAVLALTAFLDKLLKDSLKEGLHYIKERAIITMLTDHYKKSIFGDYGNIEGSKHTFKNNSYVGSIKKVLCKLNIELLAGGVDVQLNEEIIVSKHGKSNRPEGSEHRFRSGTVANRNINKFEKQAGLHVRTARGPLARAMRERLGPEKRLAVSAVVVMQLYLEKYIENLLRNANSFSRHAGRQGVRADDIMLAINSQNGLCNAV